MSQTAQKIALSIHLDTATSCLKRGDFKATQLALRNALKLANSLEHGPIKKLIFRAMNHARNAERIAA